MWDEDHTLYIKEKSLYNDCTFTKIAPVTLSIAQACTIIATRSYDSDVLIIPSHMHYKLFIRIITDMQLATFCRKSIAKPSYPPFLTNPPQRWHMQREVTQEGQRCLRRLVCDWQVGFTFSVLCKTQDGGTQWRIIGSWLTEEFYSGELWLHLAKWGGCCKL